jgi:DNA polymerase
MVTEHLFEDRSAARQGKIRTLSQLEGAIHACKRCPLYKKATQAVPGQGGRGARVMLVGEQPGNDEDVAGRPFVGPAGHVLDTALEAAGIDRRTIYVTNAVKHFKFVRRGKRRLHERPSGEEVAICRVWNEIERSIVKPDVTIALGATAARSLMGKAVTISEVRGEVLDTPAGRLIVTIHPSYLLRIKDADDRKREYRAFVRDLKRARSFV